MDLTADWMRRISAGGGFMLHAAGTAASGRAFLENMFV